MAVYQEGAYECLRRWVQVECRKFGDIDNPVVGELLNMDVCCIKESVLFKYCAEEVANMRHNALFRRFSIALTCGGAGGMPRPIEVHDHDPLRHVGDILGWLRQMPQQILDQLLADSQRILSDSRKTECDMTFVLDRIFDGVCRPFKISDLLGRDAALCNSFWALKDASQKTFFELLKSRGEKLQRFPPLVAADPSPPPAVREGVFLLLEIIETLSSMMGSCICKETTL